jgi:hypothetical protein
MFFECFFSGRSLFLKCSVQVFHDFMVDVSPVGTETSGEAFRNVQEFMNYRLFFLLLSHPVIPFRDYFDDVGGWKVERLLPYPAETVDAGNGAFGCGSPASDAEHELRNDMEKVQAICDFVSKPLDVRSVRVLDGHNPHRTLLSSVESQPLPSHMFLALAAARKIALAISDTPMSIIIVAQN